LIPTNPSAIGTSDRLDIIREWYDGSSNPIKDNTVMKTKQPKQTIIKVEENAAGHAVGWNLGQSERHFSIKPPFEIKQAISFEFTLVNYSKDAVVLNL